MAHIFSHQRIIPFGHGDIAGITYTPRFADYCMEAQEEWLKEVIGLNWYQINVDNLYTTPTLNMTMDFIGPLYPGDTLNTDVKIEKIGNSSFTTQLRGWVNKDGVTKEIYKGKMTLSFANKAVTQSIPIPTELRIRMEQYQQQFPIEE